jgi:hypothetical protein
MATSKNQPRLLKHREAMNLAGSRSKIDKIIGNAFKEYDKKEDAIEKWKNWVIKNIQSLQDQINTKSRGHLTIESLVLIHTNGKLKLNYSIIVRLMIDSRGELALKLIREFLDEKLKVERSKLSNDDKMIIEFLQELFVQRRRKLVVTDGILRFTKMSIGSIHDKRLKEAHKILKESIFSDRSLPYVKLYVKNDRKWEPYSSNRKSSRKIAA